MGNYAYLQEEENLSGWDAGEYEHFCHFNGHSGHTTEDRAMKTSQMIQSKFLKKDDFPSPEVLTIKDVTLEEVGKGDTRWVMWFKEKAKGIVLNVTKIKQTEAAYGDDSDMWNGRKVKVMHDPTVMMGTQQVGGIKFVFPTGAQPPAPAPQPVAAGDFDDDIPF